MDPTCCDQCYNKDSGHCESWRWVSAYWLLPEKKGDAFFTAYLLGLEGQYPVMSSRYTNGSYYIAPLAPRPHTPGPY